MQRKRTSHYQKTIKEDMDVDTGEERQTKI